MFYGKQLPVLVVLIIMSGGSIMVEAAEVPWIATPNLYQQLSDSSPSLQPRILSLTAISRSPFGAARPGSRLIMSAFKPVTFPQSATEIASLWTPAYVYFAFRCKYTTLNLFEGKDPSKDFWTLWDRDVVEVFLNPHPEHMKHYYEFEVAPNNLWIDLEIDLDKKPSEQCRMGFRVRARDAR